MKVESVFPVCVVSNPIPREDIPEDHLLHLSSDQAEAAELLKKALEEERSLLSKKINVVSENQKKKQKEEQQKTVCFEITETSFPHLRAAFAECNVRFGIDQTPRIENLAKAYVREVFGRNTSIHLVRLTLFGATITMELGW